jgi:hypothetical protein
MQIVSGNDMKYELMYATGHNIGAQTEVIELPETPRIGDIIMLEFDYEVKAVAWAPGRQHIVAVLTLGAFPDRKYHDDLRRACPDTNWDALRQDLLVDIDSGEQE